MRARLFSSLGGFYEDETGEKPVPPDMPFTKRVFTGGCVETGIGSRVGGDISVWAHAHCHPENSHYGWVCFEHPDDLDDREMRLHEDAHMETGSGHDDAWRAAMIAKGGTVLEAYKMDS